MNDEMTEQQILEQVAAGTLDPAEGAALLDRMDTAGTAAGAAGVTTTGPGDEVSSGRTDTSGEPLVGHTFNASAPTAAETTRVLVRATSRRVRIIGDPSVSTVAVDGEHTVRREGGTLVISGESGIAAPDDAFVLIAGGQWREVADRAATSLLRDLELRVRVRPDLPVGVESIAGSVHVERAWAVDHIRLTAGSLRATDLENPVDVLVQAGSAQVSGRLRSGSSRVRCESGSINLALLEGSDVRIRSDVQLGRVTTVPERRGRDRNRDIVVGTGAGEIDVEVVMGHVTIALPDKDGVYE